MSENFYVAPLVEVAEIEVEKGFEGSNTPVATTETYGDGEW